MFRKNLRLFVTAIGLAAVLVMGLAMPGVTQQNPLTRQGVVSTIKGVLSSALTLTAAEGEILNLDEATVVSSPFATVTYIPIARESRSSQRLINELGKDDFAPIFLGVIFVDQHPTFPKGLFRIFLTSSGILRLVDQDGNVVQIPGKIPTREIKLASMPWKLTFEISLPVPQQNQACGSSGSTDPDSLLDCRVATVCTRVKFLGWTIFEVCQDVIICD